MKGHIAFSVFFDRNVRPARTITITRLCSEAIASHMMILGIIIKVPSRLNTRPPPIKVIMFGRKRSMKNGSRCRIRKDTVSHPERCLPFFSHFCKRKKLRIPSITVNKRMMHIPASIIVCVKKESSGGEFVNIPDNPLANEL